MRGYANDKDALQRRLRRIEAQQHCLHDALAADPPDADTKVTGAVDAVRRLVRS